MIKKINPSKKTMEQSIQILSFIQQSIEKEDKTSCLQLIETLPLNQLNLEQSNKLLNRFLTLARQVGSYMMGCILYYGWVESYPEEDVTSFFSKMFLDPVFTIDNLKFLMTSFDQYQDLEYNEHPHYAYVDVMMDLISKDSDPKLEEACQRVIQVYGEQKIGTYQELYQTSEEEYNEVILNFLLNKIRNGAPPAPKPEWINHNYQTWQLIMKELEVSLPQKEYQLSELPSESLLNKLFQHPSSDDDNLPQHINDEELKELIIQSIGKAGFHFDNIEKIDEWLKTSQPQDKERLINVLRKSWRDEKTQDNLLRFRLLGPFNVVDFSEKEIEDTLDEDSRMFSCHVNDYNSEYNRYDNWFLGYCMYCDLKIKHYWYALRIPVFNGGWFGCYCSFPCLRKAIREDYEPGYTESCYLDYFEQQIQEIGIQDRIYDFPHDDELETPLHLSLPQLEDPL